MVDRKRKVLKRINLKEGVGLELGPLYSPIVEKDEAKVYYVDHMSTQDLKKKYTGHPFDVNSIVEVDYVVGASTLRRVVKGKKFDFIVASHVIEHIPDIVRWLQDITHILKPGGILSLVIPDKRYSFDISRELSRPSEVIGAYYDNTSRFTSAMIYDSASEYREVTAVEAWADTVGHFDESKQWNLNEAIRRVELNLKPHEYIDCHGYVFTPQSFFNILRRLMLHGLIDLEVLDFVDTAQNELEFYVSLRKPKRLNKKKQLASLPDMGAPMGERELLHAIERLQAELDAIKSSKSWRAVEPARRAYAQSRQVVAGGFRKKPPGVKSS